MKCKFIVDLLKGPDNQNWDLGRVLSFLSALAMVGGEIWNGLLGMPVELGPTGFGGGLAAVLGGCAALIYAKDRARAENVVAKAANTTANTAAVKEGKA
jgi:hypothetical protein